MHPQDVWIAEILQLSGVNALEYKNDDTSCQFPVPISIALFMRLATSGRVRRAAVRHH